MTSLIRLILFGLLSLGAIHTQAQESSGGGGAGSKSQAGAFIGNMLPNNVPGMDEITPLWGLRYSYPIANMVYAEGGTVFSHSNGVDWKGAFASIRMDISMETLIAMTYIGLDYTNYSGEGQKTTNKGGGHAGGGVMSELGGNTYMRFDMKLNSQPGTSLYFALGLSYLF
jgi:hypothetical protein